MSTKKMAEAPPPSGQEKGYVVPEPLRGLGVIGVPDWGTWNVDEDEYVAALKWPNSIVTFNKMRSDPQIDALLRSMFQPILRFRLQLSPEGASKEVCNALAEDLGIPQVGEMTTARTGRYRRNRFSMPLTLRNALLAYIYGHMYMEQVGEIEADGNGRLLWRLRKLAPRMPSSIAEIRVARDGGLVWIKQKDEWLQEPIPITQLVAFVHEREGANWFGRSLLRSAYQPWVLKDRLLRVDAVRHERNGMGVPIVELPERATKDQREEAQKLAQGYKTGMASGGVVPFGMNLRLIGVEGATSDVMASVRYHDEAMARIMLQMFMQLGGSSDYGSKALGDTFVEFFAKSQDSAAKWFVDTMNDFMVADWVEWNYGPDEPPPCITYKRDEDPDLAAQEFAQLVAQGVLTVDEDTENFVRDRYGLPPLKPGTRQDVTQNTPPGTTDPNADPNYPAAPGNTQMNPQAARGEKTRFRRKYNEHEMAAGADFDRLHANWVSALDEASAFWRGIRRDQIDELITAVRASTDIGEVDELLPTLRGVSDLEALMQRVAAGGVESALGEAISQGINLSRPVVPDMAPLARTTATLLGRSLGAAASRVAVRGGGGDAGARALQTWGATLSDSFSEMTLGGALTSAQNAGRFAVMSAASPEPDLFASEIMDANTCEPCRGVDGRQFMDFQEALTQYPTGGFISCTGQERCRGTLVAVYHA